MITQKEYIPVPNNLSLTVRKEHRMAVLKRTGATILRITWKTLLYAFVLTLANVII